MHMNMTILMAMNIYITTQNQEYLKVLKKKGQSMSGLINELLANNFATVEQVQDIIPNKTPALEKVLIENFVEASPKKNSEDFACCKLKTPCRHWNFDGEVWVNANTGERRDPA